MSQRLCDGRGGGIDSRDARASGLKRARRCHVCLSSDRTACAVPLVLIAYGDAQFGGQAQGHGDRVAIACWLRLPSDGGKPHRNEDRSAFVSCRISKRARAWTGFVSRDARASGLKRATARHVYFRIHAPSANFWDQSLRQRCEHSHCELIRPE